MAKEPPKHRQQWSSDDVRQLQKLAGENTPTRIMALKLGRSEAGVRAKAADEHVSLKPTNQSPYNRRPK